MKKNYSIKKYPLREGAAIKIQFWALYILLPFALAFAAFFSLGGIIWDIRIGSLGFNQSLYIILAGLIIFGTVAGYLFYKCWRFGSFKGFYHARNSRAFKKAESALLKDIKEKFSALPENNHTKKVSEKAAKKADEEKEECLRDLKYCEERLKGYKNFYKISDSEGKLESVVYTETKKLKGLLDSDEPDVFTLAGFAATLKKVRFCLAERFTGLKAESYRGGGKYVFISYSHADTKVVLETVKKLQEAKINVWFDEGITEGDDWMDHLAKKIDGCAHFLMFQTKNYINSVNCNVEIKRALKMGKTILRLILDDAKLPEGIEMYLDAIQAHDGRAELADKIDKIIKQLKAAAK